MRADLVDRLVNQAGEVAIARSRMEAEMLALKQSLLDLTDNVSRLRNQLREIEIQAESQMARRVCRISSREHDEFDPLEFDRFTRLQELTRFMAESVNDISHGATQPAEEPRRTGAAFCWRRRVPDQGFAAGADAHPHGAVLQRIRTSVPYRASGRQGSRQEGQSGDSRRPGGNRPFDAGKLTAPFEHMLRNSIDHGLENRDRGAKYRASLKWARSS